MAFDRRGFMARLAGASAMAALGPARFFEHGTVQAVINGARYEIDLYRSDDGQSLRTTFPRFVGLA